MQKMILAYVFDRDFRGMLPQDAARLTHVNYSFALIKEGRADVSHWRHVKELRLMLEQFPNLHYGLSVGGWAAEGFSEAVASAAGREMLAQSLIDLLREWPAFTGIDLDWEYPGSSVGGIISSPDDEYNYPLFIKLLRQKLDALGEERGLHYMLSMAVGAAAKLAAQLHYDEIADAMDYINLMSYDMATWDINEPTGHHAALYPSAGQAGQICGQAVVESYHAAGVPHSKLVLGAAFYGRGYVEVEEGGTGGLYQRHAGVYADGMTYADICARLQSGTQRQWDAAARAPYFYDEHERIFISYEDGESLACKVDYVKKMGLAGIMFWEYCGADTSELVKALHDRMV